MIRLVIIEDEELIQIGITTAINQQPDMQMVGIARTGNEGVKLVGELTPDLVLVDIGLPDISGLDVIKQIKQFNCKIIVLSSYSSTSIVQSALKAGADSYVLKKNDLALILEAIKATHNHQGFIDCEIAKRGLQNFFPHSKVKGKTYLDSLTSTEVRIISLMAAGYNNKEISQYLFITESTVKGHSSSIFSKLGVSDRVKAILKAVELGYIPVDSLIAG